MKWPLALPLFAQTLGLVIATVIAAQTSTVVVILSLPPPSPEIYTVGDVAQAIRFSGARTGKTADGALTTRRNPAPPAIETWGRHRLMFRDALANTLGISPASVVVDQRGSRIVALGGRRPPRSRAEAVGPEPLLFGRFEVGVKQADGEWLVVQPRVRFGFDPWQERLLLVTALATLAASPLAWAFSRRLAAPITALAAGAERLGRDPGAPPLAVGGSAEVAVAVAAFNQMQERLRRYVDDRTGMIGAIAHDLRTPLTRLRFRIDAIPEPLRLSWKLTSIKWKLWWLRPWVSSAMRQLPGIAANLRSHLWWRPLWMRRRFQGLTLRWTTPTVWSWTVIPWR